jgi:hypothetical protein
MLIHKFTLKGNELTFKATAFKARNNATYRVNIRATKVENNIINFFVLVIGKTDLNAIHKTIGTKTARLLVFMTNIR